MKKEYDPKRIVSAYLRSNYRILGPSKHSAIKPCHWLEQKLLTGRANRNCYKGYFGIESERCIQNTPSLPFCNHQCVFCWRDVENGSFGSEWMGPVDDPKLLVNEMIRHSVNIIKEHITLNRSLENLEIMQKLLKWVIIKDNGRGLFDFVIDESILSKELGYSITKIRRAMLLLKNMKILSNPEENTYVVHDRVKGELKSEDDADRVIRRDVTTKEEIIDVYNKALHPNHAAISLAGEPMLYPRIGDLVNEFRSRGFTTFIVTNGTFPNVIRELESKGQLPTQLYVTLPAPNKKVYLRVSRPLIKDGWERLMETIRLLPTLSCRTVVRITSVKYLNIDLDMVPEYARILKESPPNFIDIKGFTVEANALRLTKRFKTDRDIREFRPTFNDLLEFAGALSEATGFPIIEKNEPSNDILLRANWPEDKPITIDRSKL